MDRFRFLFFFLEMIAIKKMMKEEKNQVVIGGIIHTHIHTIDDVIAIVQHDLLIEKALPEFCVWKRKIQNKK